MRRSIVLVRIRFPLDLLERVDRLVERLSTGLRRKVPRTAVVRALMRIQLEELEDASKFAEAFADDSVRRGREKRTRPAAAAEEHR